MNRTFWLSFCDDTKPAGSRFSGVCVVDVDFVTIASAEAELQRRGHPDPKTAAPVAAAVSKAWDLKINPGGSVASTEVTGSADNMPRGRLMQTGELKRLGLI